MEVGVAAAVGDDGDCAGDGERGCDDDGGEGGESLVPCSPRCSGQNSQNPAGSRAP